MAPIATNTTQTFSATSTAELKAAAKDLNSLGSFSQKAVAIVSGNKLFLHWGRLSNDARTLTKADEILAQHHLRADV